MDVSFRWRRAEDVLQLLHVQDWTGSLEVLRKWHRSGDTDIPDDQSSSSFIITIKGSRSAHDESHIAVCEEQKHTDRSTGP